MIPNRSRWIKGVGPTALAHSPALPRIDRISIIGRSNRRIDGRDDAPLCFRLPLAARRRRSRQQRLGSNQRWPQLQRDVPDAPLHALSVLTHQPLPNPFKSPTITESLQTTASRHHAHRSLLHHLGGRRPRPGPSSRPPERQPGYDSKRFPAPPQGQHPRHATRGAQPPAGRPPPDAIAAATGVQPEW